jgi:hypothetical protein
MKQIIADKNLVAYCGLYCGACNKYLDGKCPGCQKNKKSALVPGQEMLHREWTFELLGLQGPSYGVWV